MTDKILIMIYDLWSGENIFSHGWAADESLQEVYTNKSCRLFPFSLSHTHLHSHTLGIW